VHRLAPRRTMSQTNGAVLRPVFGVDIDGTLAYFHEYFLWFASLYLGKSVPSEWDGEGPFWRVLGVPKARYREVKLAFRQSGLKRAMPAIGGATSLVRSLRNRGCEVWICTTRPYLRLDNIDPDTRVWLQRNNIPYDGVLYGERKWGDLARLVGPDRVLGVLDDLPEQLDAAHRAGLTGRLVQRPYTEGRYQNIMTLGEAEQWFLTRCSQWMKERNVRR
jgi:hypothetical protein